MKRLSPGTILLGQVADVKPLEVIFSLPNNLTGYVPITSVSSYLSNLAQQLADLDDEEPIPVDLILPTLGALFKVGQWFRLYVADIAINTDSFSSKTRRHIELSMFPEHVNGELTMHAIEKGTLLQAFVTDLEDHGVLMDVGIDGMVGFIPTKDDSHTLDLEIGQVVLCTVTSVSGDRSTAVLSPDLSQASQTAKPVKLVQNLLPGDCVSVVLASVQATGMVGLIDNLILASADIFHCGSENPLREYHEGTTVTARVLYTTESDFNTARVGVSLLPHVLSFSMLTISDQPPPMALPLSLTIENCAIKRVEPGFGVFVDIGRSEVRGFVYSSRLSDEDFGTLQQRIGPFKIDSRHTGRIMSYSMMDGVYYMSFQKRILNRAFLRFEDVPLGAKLNATVERTLDAGLIIRITDDIVGLAPYLHLVEAALKKNQYTTGSKVECRVMNIQAAKSRISLTLKKKLIDLEEKDLVTDYDDRFVGHWTSGLLLSVHHTGAKVELFGGVRAYLPVREMSETYIDDPTTHFSPGQIVDVRIVSVEPEARRMTLSIKAQGNLDASAMKAFSKYKSGTIVSGKIQERLESSLTLNLDYGITGVLPIGHLSDGNMEECKSLVSLLKPNTQVNDLVVLFCDPERNMVQLSRKHSLLQAVSEKLLPSSIDDIVAGSVLRGYISNIQKFGIFVAFGGQVSGLCNNSLLSDIHISNSHAYFAIDQSVQVKVLTVNKETNRVQLSMKESDLDLTVSQKLVLSNDNSLLSQQITSFPIGSVLKAKVISTTKTKINVELPNSLPGHVDSTMIWDDFENISNPIQPLQTFAPGRMLEVVVIGFGESGHHAGQLTLSAKPSHLTSQSSEVLQNKHVKIGNQYIAVVQSVLEHDLSISISPIVSGRIDGLEASADVSTIRKLDRHFKVGQAVKVEVIQKDSHFDHVECSIRTMTGSRLIALDDVEPGSIVPGRILKRDPRGLEVQLSNSLVGDVSVADLADRFVDQIVTKFEPNQLFSFYILKVDEKSKKIYLSLRQSRLSHGHSAILDPEISSIADVNEGKVLRGYVINIAAGGLFVTIGTGVLARVKISEMFDSFIKDWKSQFRQGQVVKGAIVLVNEERQQLEMSLKTTAINTKYHKLSDFEVGDVVDARICSIRDFGIFIDVDNSRFGGLVHRSEVRNFA